MLKGIDPLLSGDLLRFRARAANAYAVIHTLEDEGYNDFILTKGVV